MQSAGVSRLLPVRAAAKKEGLPAGFQCSGDDVLMAAIETKVQRIDLLR